MIFLRVPNFHLTATLQLTSNKGSPNSTMLPLHGLQAGAIQRSQSLITLFTSTLKLILANRNSRTIFYFLCVNLCKEMVVIICILLLWLHFTFQYHTCPAWSWLLPTLFTSSLRFILSIKKTLFCIFICKDTLNALLLICLVIGSHNKE